MKLRLPGKFDFYIQKLRNSRDGKRLVKNFGYLSILELATHLFPLITMPYLGRVIGVQGFGILAIGMSVVAYFKSFTNYGFEYSAVRDVARCRTDNEEASRRVSLTFFSKAFLMLVSIVILGICCATIPFLREYSLVIWCTFLLVPGVVLNTDWVFQAYEDMHFITVRSILAKVITTAFIFICIRQRDDYLWQPILESIGIMIPSLMGLYVMHKKYGLRVVVPSMRDILHELRAGFNMFITVFLPTIYTNLNVLVLGSFQGKEATGIYNGGSKFTSLAFSLFKLISRTVYPLFSRKLGYHALYARFSLLLSVFISLVFFVFARPLVLLLLGPEFEPTITVLRIVAFTPIAMSLMNSYGVNYLVLKNREHIMSRIILAVTIFGLAVGIIGAVYYSYVGVAVASLSTQFLRAGLVTWQAKKISKSHDENPEKAA